MKCVKCNKSVNEIMLHRTGEIGTLKPEWMCMPCIEKNEPELAKNLQEEYKDEPIINDLNNIFYK